ncbi:MAG: M20/M25/M40 family metallo-hydrolase [candidate division KSB1 bacterium]|nr:M20/M25/M40 family metallo-hydrolase [candidate division KSB1 bacterium]
MRRGCVRVLMAVAALAVAHTGLVASRAEVVNGDSILSYIRVLASDHFLGRGTGTEGGAMAEDFVAAKFRQWGLKPAGDKGTFFQTYTIPFFRLESEPVLEAGGRKFVYEEDFEVLRYSGSGELRAEVVFVGQGVVDSAGQRDDYQGVDVRGKIVLVAREAPREGAMPAMEQASDSLRAAIAKAKGARGMLVFSPPSEGRAVRPRGRLGASAYDANFLAMAVDARVASFILKTAGKSEQEISQLLRGGKGSSFSTGVEAHLKIDATFDPKRPARNVLAMIPGTDRKLRDEYVLIGGHLDHLGVDFRGTVYNGADDNASGIATVMEVARVMAANRIKPRRTVIFAGWTGEELGLLGSSHYAAHPIWPLERTVAYLNLDMVGRGNGKVRFSGKYYGPRVWQIMEEALGDSLRKSAEPQRGGPGGSDHTPFLVRGVPAFFLLTSGDHPDYHQPSDDWDKIQPEVCQVTGEITYRAVLALANTPAALLEPAREAEFVFRHAALAYLQPLAIQAGLDTLSKHHIDIALLVPKVSKEGSRAEKLEAILRAADSLRVVDDRQEDFDIATNPSELRMASYRGSLELLLGVRGQDIAWDTAILRNLARLDYRVLVLGDSDGVWTDGSQLTEQGREAVRLANETGLLILLEDPSPGVAQSLLATTKKPVVVAGMEGNWSEDFLQAMARNGGLLLVPYCPREKAEEIAQRLHSLRDKLKADHLGLYPHFTSPQLVRLARPIAHELLRLGWKREEVEGLLGNNLVQVMRAVSVEREMTIQFRF